VRELRKHGSGRGRERRCRWNERKARSSRVRRGVKESSFEWNIFSYDPGLLDRSFSALYIFCRIGYIRCNTKNALPGAAFCK
jgi:hypothetical protein